MDDEQLHTSFYRSEQYKETRTERAARQMADGGLHPDLLATLSGMLGEPATAPPPDDTAPTTEADTDGDTDEA